VAVGRLARVGGLCSTHWFNERILSHCLMPISEEEERPRVTENQRERTKDNIRRALLPFPLLLQRLPNVWLSRRPGGSSPLLLTSGFTVVQSWLKPGNSNRVQNGPWLDSID
jgi:hypothetical protein